ncbi:MAG: serine O-acetyltransferase [Eubacterium sp.]
MGNKIETEIADIVGNILEDYQNGRTIDQIEIFDQPDTEIVVDMIDKLLKIIFPGFFRDKSYRFYNMNSRLTVLIEDVMFNLNRQIATALRQIPDHMNMQDEERIVKAERLCLEFFKKIPKIREYVETDVQAFFDGDPAAYNRNEIILSYPGLYAITVNRIAHELFLLSVPLIPRIMTEHAHSKTGIDIHPGATIGKYFFIDHGTGIVVGETTIIGENVKVYQGVTIGALSTRGGQRLKGVKRHPTIEDNVTIYSGASILGGETLIGKGSVIGSNAFITSSIAPGTRVSIKNQELNMKSGNDVQATDFNQDEAWFYVI